METACSPDHGASLSESRELIKTYPFSDPDPVPILARSGIRGGAIRIYPYFFFDKFSKSAENAEWTVVRMENPYISVAVLPEVGGKVWGAVEKKTGKEFIYTNHVLKFREIALRGPWTSGGIEFNFGVVGHAPSTATPVDYLARRNPDGSVSCVVGTMDLPSRTRWSVTITVPKDKAYLETKAFWVNPTPYHQSYYSWMNAAVRAADDLQFIFPGTHWIGHDYSRPLAPWPVDEKGRDLSWYRNNAFGSSKSYFTVGEYEPFFGGYWYDDRFGFGHWALPDDMPGRKVWIWALSRQGMIWEQLLTDKDGQYSEPQAGRYYNQSDHGRFLPGTGDAWREIWFPYRDIGPMVEADPLGVLHVRKKGNRLEIGFFALEKTDEDLLVLHRGAELYRVHLLLDPTQAYRTEIPVGDGRLEEIEVLIGQRIRYIGDSEADDLKRPIRFHEFEEGTAEGLFLEGRRLEQGRYLYAALEKYLACLKMEPLHTRALTRSAELYCRRGEYGKARFYASRALLNEMYDPEANYVYGIVSRRLGNLQEAKEAFGWAARSMEYRSSAYTQMAEVYFLEKNLEMAAEYVERALRFNTDNLNALLLASAVHRSSGRTAQAKAVLERILELDPLCHLARYEAHRIEPSEKKLRVFREMIRNEFPEETLIEAALHYVRLGLRDEAGELFRLADDHPTACFWLAYLERERDPAASSAFLRRANSLSPLHVFPFREESIPVLEWAVREGPQQWKSAYYLALIYWSKGRLREAKELFDACRNPDFPFFYLARGHFYRNFDLDRSREDFEEARRREPKSWKIWDTLIDFYNQQGLYGPALEAARKAVRLFPGDDALLVDKVEALLGEGLYSEAAAVLEDLEVLPSEGARAVHGMFVRCYVHLALESMLEGEPEKAVEFLRKAKTYPENLGTGRPFDPDQRLQDYLLSLCMERTGKKEEAGRLEEEIAAFSLKHWEERSDYDYFGGLVFLRLGERARARELMRRRRPPEDLLRKIRAVSR